MMPYETYTPPEDIRPNSRKSALRLKYETHGEAAMRKLNKTFKHPIKDSSLAVWLSHWRYVDAA